MYYLIVHCIDKAPVGSSMDKLPLHMTFLQWFYSQTPAEKFIAAFKETLKNQQPLTASVSHEDLFGPNNDVLVDRIVRTDELITLHEKLAHTAEKQNASYLNPGWVHAGWNPHVTPTTNRRLQKEDVLAIDSIDLVAAPDIKNDRKIIVRFVFE